MLQLLTSSVFKQLNYNLCLRSGIINPMKNDNTGIIVVQSLTIPIWVEYIKTIKRHPRKKITRIQKQAISPIGGFSFCFNSSTFLLKNILFASLLISCCSSKFEGWWLFFIFTRPFSGEGYFLSSMAFLISWRSWWSTIAASPALSTPKVLFKPVDFDRFYLFFIEALRLLPVLNFGF